MGKGREKDRGAKGGRRREEIREKGENRGREEEG